MGTAEEPDVWPRTVEISFGKVEVSRHDFYNCFEPEGVEVSAFDAVARLPGRTICIFRVGFKSDEAHIAFISSFSQKQSVTINGKEVAIRVRDRTMNLVRVRVHHYKFSDDIGMLAMRLRQYGKVTKLAWDTYQDKQLPKWSGIKTGVVNVDMEIVSNIPSYISFGNYKHPLMVEYAGQTKTCRLCDSPCHVSNVCPKVINKVTPVVSPANPVSGPRSYSTVAKLTHKPPTFGWQKKTGNKAVPIEEPDDVSDVTEMVEKETDVPKDSGSNPDENEAFSESEESADDGAAATVTIPKPMKRKPSSSKEQRDNEKQQKRDSRRSSLESQGTDSMDASDSESVKGSISTLGVLQLLANEGEKSNGGTPPPPPTNNAELVAQPVTDTDSSSVILGSIPTSVPDSQEMELSEPIPAAQPPNIGSETAIQPRKGSMRTTTLAAMTAVAQKKLSQVSQKSTKTKATTSKSSHD